MTDIRFEHYPAIAGLTVDEADLIGIYSLNPVDGTEPLGEKINRAMDNPIGTPPLSTLAAGMKQVLILVDDNTRTTPVDLMLPPVLDALRTAGVPSEGISIMVALGTHRDMTGEECEKKFGAEIRNTVPIHMHHWNRAEALQNIGTTPKGTEMIVNRRLLASDLVIGLGQIVPHRVAGFSGGAKIVQPGVCGGITTGQTHWLSAEFTGREIMGKIDNPVREEMNQVAAKANLKFIVNAVMDQNDDIAYMVCGDPVAAFREGARLSRDVFNVAIPEEADIVITDSYPADLEMWQASKGIYAADLAVRQGGVIIMASPCPEGVCAEHPDLLKYGYLTYAEVLDLVDSGTLTDLTLAAHLIHVGRVIKERATGILVSPGIPREDAEALGFLHADTLEQAYQKAREIIGRPARVMVLKHAGHILPVAPGA